MPWYEPSNVLLITSFTQNSKNSYLKKT